MKRIITLTVLLLIVALALTACGGKKNKEKEETVYDILADVFENTANANAGETASVWKEALKGGSIESDLTYNEAIIPLKSISSKLYFGENASASNISIGLFTGETFDLSQFADNEKIVFLSSAFTGAYGFTADGYVNFLMKTLMSASGSTGSAGSVTAIDPALFEKHEQTIRDSLALYFPLLMQEAESSLNFTFSLSNTNIKAFLTDMIKIFETDAELKATIMQSSSMTSAEYDASLAEAKADLAALDEEPFIASVSIIATKERVMSSAAISVYEGTATTNKIANILISLPADGGFKIDATVDGESFTVSYTVSKFGTVSKGSLAIGTQGITLTPLTLTYDSANGDYEVKVEIPATFTATAKGKYTATATDATVTLTKLQLTIPTDYSDMESILGGAINTTVDLPMTMTIKAKAKDTVPTAPKSYTDVNTLSEEQLAELTNALMSDPVVQTYMQMAEGLFGSAEPKEEVKPID